jgi:transmembrane sensor
MLSIWLSYGIKSCYMMQNNRLWLLMARRLSGEASPVEQEELQDFLERHPEKQYLLELLHSYFDAHRADDLKTVVADADFEERFFKATPQNSPLYSTESIPLYSIGDRETYSIGGHETRGEQDNASGDPYEMQPDPSGKVSRLRPGRILRVAASIAGVLVLGWGSYRLFQPSASQAPLAPIKAVAGNEVTARPGARTKLVLPDGTQVWLNSGSKLNYHGDFNIHDREVTLEGEAFFEVAKDPEHPFIVHADVINIKVLGTAFTVRSYPQDETTETTLLRGAIEVTRQDNPSTLRITLKPNEKLILSRHPSLQPRKDIIPAKPDVVIAAPAPDIAIAAISNNIPDSNKVETSWMYNKLVFNGDSFRELAEKMERWYDVKIVFKDESLYKYHFGGVFADETVEKALNALQLTAKFTYSINNNEIELYGK